MTEHDLDPAAIQREQVDTIFRQMPIILLLELLGGCFLFVFALVATNNYSLLAIPWVGFLAISVTIRFMLERRLNDEQQITDNLNERLRFLFFSAFTSSLVWGTTWLIVPFESMDAPRGATIVWPVAMLASAFTNLAINKKLYFCFAIPVALMHGGAMFFMDNPLSTRYMIGMAPFLAFMSVLAIRVHKDLNLSLKLKLENKILQDNLKADQERLEQQQSELMARIKREKSLVEEKSRVDDKLELANEEKLLLLDAAGEGIFGTNVDGCITFVNDAALRLLGFKESDVLGQDSLALLCRGNSDTGKEAQTRKAILRCFLEGESVDSIGGVFSGSGDKVIPITFSCRPIIKNDRFIGAVVSFFDMTRQFEMESRLAQSQKMEAIGRITGGVAHDFNNLLTVLLGNLQFLRKRLSADANGNEIELIEKMVSATKSGADLNNRLLSYSREQSLKSAAENINTILIDMKGFMERVLGEDIQFELDLSEPDAIAMIDRAQFENVILNLCMNARDAMPNGGKMLISSKIVQLTEDPPLPPAMAAGEYMELTITDSGTGIPAEIQSKIFDPFFTTKERGAGSGFGLSTTFGFMQQSGGNISVRSRLGEGATFILHLPLSAKSTENADSDARQITQHGQYSGTVLIVEDDDGVRDVTCQTLMEAGYKVIAANSGPDGLEKFNKHTSIDLVFSDIIMPGGMTGIEMAIAMQQDRPEIQVLLATGYTEKLLRDRIADDGNIVCIAKPYDFDELPGLINTMLNKAA